jgi:hypothetical protein
MMERGVAEQARLLSLLRNVLMLIDEKNTRREI